MATTPAAVRYSPTRLWAKLVPKPRLGTGTIQSGGKNYLSCSVSGLEKKFSYGQTAAFDTESSMSEIYQLLSVRTTKKVECFAAAASKWKSITLLRG